jgi:probable addiction module antidote protein
MMMGIKTYPWDVTEHLDSDEAIAAYLAEAIESADIAYIRHALSNVARARGMTQVAKDAGITRAGLYKALGEDGNPSFENVLAITKALGVKLSIAA